MEAPKHEILTLYNGLHVAVKLWGKKDASTRILALHGWLDTAGSWDALVPHLLADNDYYIACIDFTGHGFSDHRGSGADYSMPNWVLEVMAIVDALGWTTFVLMGHSMGGAIATLVAGAVPEIVQKLILIDSLAPWPGFPGGAREALRMRIEGQRKGRRQAKVFESEEKMISKYSRNIKLSPDLTRMIVCRNMSRVRVTEPDESSRQGWVWRHDPRLYAHSSHRYTEGEILEFLRAITAPVLLMWAENEDQKGFRSSEEVRDLYATRYKSINSISLQNVKGPHHIHLAQAALVGQHIIKFLSQPLISASRL